MSGTALFSPTTQAYTSRILRPCSRETTSARTAVEESSPMAARPSRTWEIQFKVRADNSTRVPTETPRNTAVTVFDRTNRGARLIGRWCAQETLQFLPNPRYSETCRGLLFV